MSNFPVQFHYVPYPLWRRILPPFLKQAVGPLLRSIYPVALDLHPPRSAESVARYLHRFQLVPDATAREIESLQPNLSVTVANEPLPAPKLPLQLPAQWEPLEAVLVTLPVTYPPLWPLHAAMIEAISQVADVEITVPAPLWANAAQLYLARRGHARFDRLKFVQLPTDDIWIRDFGPIIGYDASGQRAVVEVTYHTHDTYPQRRDAAAAHRYASYRGFPSRQIELVTEGGNLMSDGAGTLLMTPQVLHSNPQHTLASLEVELHEVFAFDKLIMPPRLSFETTGHIDMSVKLADAKTVLLSAPDTPTTAATLRASRDLFERETNARGESYRVFTLPSLPIYFNWLIYGIRRTYANALTVNGRVLVPVYEMPEDDAALRIYEEAMPEYEIVPINCKAAINGGGAVHCLTREVPAAR
jgi:agmatine deiminase